MSRAPSRLGSYRLLAPLARGGMAEVHLAHHVAFPRQRVALKALPEARRDDPAARAGLRREAWLTARCAHPGVVALLDDGAAGDHPYLALERVDGVDLAGLLAARGAPLPAEAACGVVHAAAQALDHVHRALDPAGAPLGVVHRDVSPSNLMLDQHGEVRVIDLGVAAAARTPWDDAAGVAPGDAPGRHVRGKAGYMAPEQAAGGPVDARADVFGLGAVLHELLAGAPCFAGGGDHGRLLAAARGDRALLRVARPGLPAALDDLVARAVAPDPDARTASAAALAEELEVVAARQGWRLAAPPLAALTGRRAALARGTDAAGLVAVTLDHQPTLPFGTSPPRPPARRAAA